MNKEQELQAELNKIRANHLELKTRFKGLINALYDAEILYGIGHKYEFFHAGVNILNMQKEFEERQKLILEHLGMELKLVECEDHYELRYKGEKK